MVFAVKSLTLSPWGFSHSVPADSYIWLPFQLQHSRNDNTVFLLDYIYYSVYEVGCRWFFDHNLLIFKYTFLLQHICKNYHTKNHLISFLSPLHYILSVIYVSMSSIISSNSAIFFLSKRCNSWLISTSLPPIFIVFSPNLMCPNLLRYTFTLSI